MSEPSQSTNEPTSPQEAVEGSQEERSGLNAAGADVGMGEPNTFEPEEG